MEARRTAGAAVGAMNCARRLWRTVGAGARISNTRRPDQSVARITGAAVVVAGSTRLWRDQVPIGAAATIRIAVLPAIRSQIISSVATLAVLVAWVSA